MAVTKFFNRAKMSVASAPGTGTAALGSAIAGYLSFASAGVVDGDSVSYLIEDGTSFEIGKGVYTASGTTLARTTVDINSSGTTSKITASANAIVSITAVKADLDPATVAEIKAAVSKYITAANAWAMAAFYDAGNSGSATLTLDLFNGFNQKFIANGNFTLAAFTNCFEGQSGTIRIQQDGTGSRVWTLNSAFKTAGGTPAVLTTGPNLYDNMDYKIEAVSAGTATRIRYALNKDVK